MVYGVILFPILLFLFNRSPLFQSGVFLTTRMETGNTESIAGLHEGLSGAARQSFRLRSGLLVVSSSAMVSRRSSILILPFAALMLLHARL